MATFGNSFRKNNWKEAMNMLLSALKYTSHHFAVFRIILAVYSHPYFSMFNAVFNLKNRKIKSAWAVPAKSSPVGCQRRKTCQGVPAAKAFWRRSGACSWKREVLVVISIVAFETPPKPTTCTSSRSYRSLLVRGFFFLKKSFVEYRVSNNRQRLTKAWCTPHFPCLMLRSERSKGTHFGLHDMWLHNALPTF